MEDEFGAEEDRPVRKIVKGRGTGGSSSQDVREMGDMSRYKGAAGVFDSVDSRRDGSSGPGPSPSIEGWIIFISNVNQEATEEDVVDRFGEYGEVKNIQMNLDRKTGFVKGYALVEYETKAQAKAAIDDSDGQEIFGQIVSVDWAFWNGPSKELKPRRRRVSGEKRAASPVTVVKRGRT